MIEQTIDDILVDGKSIFKENRYKETKRRLSNINKKYMMCSDKEIIEYLVEEIGQYRNTIEKQRRIIDKLNKSKAINTEKYTYHCGVDGGTRKDFTVIEWYEDGILVKEEIKPCNK